MEPKGTVSGQPEVYSKLCPGAKVGKGLPIRGGGVQKAENDITAWLRESGLIG